MKIISKTTCQQYGQDLFAPTLAPTLIKTPINNSQSVLFRVVVTERLRLVFTSDGVGVVVGVIRALMT